MFTLPSPSPLAAGKWPDAIEPFQKMKAAMGCQLAQQLQTTLGLDATATEVRSSGCPTLPGAKNKMLIGHSAAKRVAGCALRAACKQA